MLKVENKPLVYMRTGFIRMNNLVSMCTNGDFYINKHLTEPKNKKLQSSHKRTNGASVRGTTFFPAKISLFAGTS